MSAVQSIQEKLLWWEELAAWLQSRAALLRQEAMCRLRLVAKALEQLTSNGQLSFSHMEGLLSELKGMLQDELQQCNEGEAIAMLDLTTAVHQHRNYCSVVTCCHTLQIHLFLSVVFPQSASAS